MLFAENLKRLRESRRLSKSDMAKKLDITPSAYGAYELKRREPSFEMLCKIADVLHVTTDELLGHKLGDAYDYCKTLIESFEYEYMDVSEEQNGAICVTLPNGEVCHFQSKKEFVNHVLAWENSFSNNENYKIYFNVHMYESMRTRREFQKMNSDRLQYIKESLDIIANDTQPETKKELKAILTQALKTTENQAPERSADNE